MSVSVLGAGAFGTALAISLARDGRDIALWARDAGAAARYQAERENSARLAGARFPESLRVTGDFATSVQADVILLAVPMQQLAPFAHAHRTELQNKTLVACCKGIDLESLSGPATVLSTILPNTRVAILTGPSFAHDIAVGLPTALTLAAEFDARDLQAELSTANLRVYTSRDVIGAELGGALKNVMAIACGAAMGAGLGDSARAALITRGFAEMQRMALALGAVPETLSGLSGFGDLVLTCTSEGSRNYRYGLALGRREGFDGSVTVEGAATARACEKKAREIGLDMPITKTVVGLMSGELTLNDAMTGLLSRPPKEETC